MAVDLEVRSPGGHWWQGFEAGSRNPARGGIQGNSGLPGWERAEKAIHVVDDPDDLSAIAGRPEFPG